jgi:hypothetical protein
MDIIYNIGLWCDLKTSISILNTCKELWTRRKFFYHEKHLLWYHKPAIDIFSPEMNFYITNRQFTLFVNEDDDIHVSYIYELNNSVKNLYKDDILWHTDSFTFYINNCYMIIWYNKSNIEFYANRQEFLKLNTTIDDYYIGIDLNNSMPVWTKYESKPYTSYNRYHVYSKNGKVVHKHF